MAHVHAHTHSCTLGKESLLYKQGSKFLEYCSLFNWLWQDFLQCLECLLCKWKLLTNGSLENSYVNLEIYASDSFNTLSRKMSCQGEFLFIIYFYLFIKRNSTTQGFDFKVEVCFLFYLHLTRPTSWVNDVFHLSMIILVYQCLAIEITFSKIWINVIIKN